MINTINSWGNNFRADINCLNKLPEDKSKILIFGNNNSYGDASIPLESQTVNVENLNRDMYYLSPLTANSGNTFPAYSLHGIQDSRSAPKC